MREGSKNLPPFSHPVSLSSYLFSDLSGLANFEPFSDMSAINALAPNMAYAFILNPLAGGQKDPSFFAKVIDQFCREKKWSMFSGKQSDPDMGESSPRMP